MTKGKRNVQRLPARSRTRLHKPKLADPERNSADLSAQLASLGMRLHDTVGDGNCLFRALSDQLFGTEKHHLTLRAEITAWMSAHPERYSGFVEDDRGLDDHLRCMRVPGTYGGHLELTAFAHLKRKNVKVVQPGLVFVIEWNAGEPTEDTILSESEDDSAPLSSSQERDRRRARREKKRGDQTSKAKDTPTETVYVAYHDWEHFSSIRTLGGGLPMYANTPDHVEEGEEEELPQQPVASTSKQLVVKVKKARGRPRKDVPAVPRISTRSTTLRMTASEIPLPRSPSPSTISSLSESTASSSLAPLTPSDRSSNDQAKARSPKRLLEDDELDDIGLAGSSAEMSETRSAKRRAGDLDIASGLQRSHHLAFTPPAPAPATAPSRHSTPLLSSSQPTVSSQSQSHSYSRSSSSDLSELTDSEDEAERSGSSAGATRPSSPPPPPPRAVPSSTPRLTRRQRKQLNLPKPRTRRVILTVNGKRPGGKPKPTLVEDTGDRSAAVSTIGIGGVGPGVGVDGQEWAKNGNGRLDVRGFRELKI